MSSSSYSDKFKKQADWLLKTILAKKRDILNLNFDKKELTDITTKLDDASALLKDTLPNGLVGIFKEASLDKWLEALEYNDREVLENVEHLSPNKELAKIIRVCIDHQIFDDKKIKTIIMALRCFIIFSIKHYNSEGEVFLVKQENETSEGYYVEMVTLLEAAEACQKRK